MRRGRGASECLGPLALLALAACFTESTQRKAPIARCADKQGDVRSHPSEEATWQPLAVGAELGRGEWIQTAADAWAELSFFAGGALRVEPGSVVVLEDPEEEESSGRQLVALKSGSVQGELGASGQRRELVVKTTSGKRVELRPAGGSGELGYQVGLTESGDLRLAVRRGQATVRSEEGETITLERGQAQEVRAGRLVGQVVVLPLPPAPAREAGPARIPEGKPVRLSWRPERGARRFRVQIAADPTFRQILREEVVEGAGLDYVPPGPGRFHWRVAGEDDAGRAGEYSVAESVEVERPRPDLLLEPPDGATVRFAQRTPSLLFRWQPAQGPYRLVVASDPGLQSAVLSERPEGPEHRTRRLGAGVYYWGVYAGTCRSLIGPGGLRWFGGRGWSCRAGCVGSSDRVSFVYAHAPLSTITSTITKFVHVHVHVHDR